MSVALNAVASKNDNENGNSSNDGDKDDNDEGDNEKGDDDALLHRCMIDLNIAVCLFVDTRTHAKDKLIETSKYIPMRSNIGQYPDSGIIIISLRLEFEDGRSTKTKLDRHWRSTLERTYRFSMCCCSGGTLLKLYFEKS